MAIAQFYLYGEPQQDVSENFIHVESLELRSRPSEWTIRPHRHRDLNHIIHIAGGGGSMRAEAAHFTFDAPCLLLVPAGIVHGFEWVSESYGSVTTIANRYLAEVGLRHPDLAGLLLVPEVVRLVTEESGEVERLIADMSRELAWISPGQRARVEADLLTLMVIALRRREVDADGAKTPVPGRQAALVARFRERIEERFRLRESVGDHADALGVSVTALRVACARLAGRPPAMMLDERGLLEARRLLLYSNLSVAEIAYAIGFDDPAYFSRFFTRHIGVSPRHYRLRHSDGVPAGQL
ncbi:MAG: helix-turn-helix domain-containing protein [Sphingomonadales bacterium]|nr:MAG: helix-turn-helix domain-containing protein [Sphingomonadales bacterium]TNF02176.1 MAG: helix-turn-helix domain-containing protein [Sphingomonadales bacterium]